MVRTRSLALLVLLGLTSCSRTCQPVQRCPTAGFVAPSAPPPQPPAPVAWTEHARGAAIEASFELARARIARADGQRDEALAAYASGVRLLSVEAAPAAMVALRGAWEQEAADLRATHHVRPPSEPRADRVGPAALRSYDVSDLVAAMGLMGFPRVEIVGPEGTREEPFEAVLGGQLYTVLPAADGPIGREVLDELETRPGMLMLRARPLRHRAMHLYLAAMRAAWMQLWPESFPGASREAVSLVVEVHDVADLVAATPVERLRERLEAEWIHRPGEPPLEIRASGTLNLVVQATRAQQTRVHDALEALRRERASR